jgi:hypothetical protein
MLTKQVGQASVQYLEECVCDKGTGTCPADGGFSM